MEFGRFKPIFQRIYGTEQETVQRQLQRYQKLEDEFKNRFGSAPEHWFSTPGRTEIGGNHTDHNHGRVLAAGVNLDAVAAVNPADDNKVVVISEGYEKSFEVDLNDLKVKDSEKGGTNALIRGIAYRLNEMGFRVGGFKAVMTSDVLPGSGLSSSAVVEVLIATIFNYLYNRGKIDPETIAVTGQFAENRYFGKPCGLMDQMACAIGGIITIDFKNPQEPDYKKIDFNFAKQDYRLLVVDTGGNHADLTEDYAAVPAEMKSVARALGKEVCRDITLKELLAAVPELRKKTGDRAILRAYHFIRENQRVIEQVKALTDGDFRGFLKLVRDSGNSSFKWLQNIFTPKQISKQGVSLALALSEDFINEIGEGACRVHGGGFAGTIQVFLPSEAVNRYIEQMEPIFGAGSVRVLNIRSEGSLYLNKYGVLPD
ncbi:MAG: galactokinase [Calditrichaeota bacterium]|nr:galactokinase [Calditrichota bacterium]